MMKRKANVVMLPTEKASLLALNKGKLFLSESKLDYIKDSALGTEPQHLYFTTDEEIKEGDWVYDPAYNRVAKYLNRLQGGNCSDHCKKIVATTDPELWRKPAVDIRKTGSLYSLDGVDKIPTDFIEAYVREQGKITEVMLEYEVAPPSERYGKAIDVLKLRPNGTVIVHPIVRTMEDELARELTSYIKLKHSQDQCMGFSDGFQAAWKLLKGGKNG